MRPPAPHSHSGEVIPGPIRYATSHGFSIAWQEFGSGPLALVFVWGNPNHIESLWEWPPLAEFLRGMGSFGRVVHLDQRGSGSSARVDIAELPSLDERIDDVLAVLDAAGMSEAVVIGESEGAPVAVRLAAEHPHRVSRLVLLSPALRGLLPVEYRDETLEMIGANWGGPLMVELQFPAEADDPRFCAWYSKMLRSAASPGDARAMLAMDADVDEMAALAEVRCPALVVSHDNDPFVPAGDVREVASTLPDGSLVLIPGEVRAFGSGRGDEECLAAVAEFLGHESSISDGANRRRRAVLFTDIVDSTRLAAAIGDGAWRELLNSHDRIMSAVVHAHQGDWSKSTGDGVAATFRDSGSAVRAAADAHRRLTELGIEMRAGAHIGQIDIRGSDIGGITVHTAARIADAASAGQTLVSADLAGGLGGSFDVSLIGRFQLKGVPGTWELHEVSIEGSAPTA